MAAPFLKALRPTQTGGLLGWVLQSGYFFGISGGLSSGAASALTPAATVTPNLTSSNVFTMTFTANTTVAVQIPSGVPSGSTARFSLTIINTSGGALTGITFAAAYKTATLSYPATGNNRTYDFWTDGTNAYQILSTADVAN